MAARSLPHNIEAEKAVLGGILLNPQESLNNVAPLISADSFYLPTHKIIYETMLKLEQSNSAIDIITLEDRLTQSNQIKQIGGTETLVELQTRVATVDNIAHHARIVRNKAVLRHFIQSASESLTKAYEDPEDVQSFLDEAEQSIFELNQDNQKSDMQPVRKLLLSTFNKIEQRYEKKETITGVPTGFAKLDEMTSGLQRADMIIVAARPSMGKTALCLNIAQFVAIEKKIPVLLFSLEMSADALVERMLSSVAKVESGKIRGGFLDQVDWMNLTKAASQLAEAPVWIDDTAAPSILEVRAKARRFRADKNIFKPDAEDAGDPLGLIVIDYLQLARGTGKSSNNREQEVAEISRGLKALAKEVNLPVIALSQLRRAAEDRKDGRPQLSDLRESGAIEQDADVIAFIHRKTREDSPERNADAELVIGKQRNGPVGNVPLVFVGKYTRFESRDVRPDEQDAYN